MKTFKNQEKCFKSDPLLDWEPVQVLKGGGDVFLGLSVSEDSGSCVLDIVKFFLICGWVSWGEGYCSSPIQM